MKKFLLFLVAAFSFLALTACHEEKKELEPDYDKFPLGAVVVWDSELGEWVLLDDLGSIFDLFQQDKSGSRSTDYTISPVFDNQSKPCFYVINISDGGWMIISATKKFKPVLALSPTGYFDVDGTLPEGLELWKENMIYTISNIDEVVPRDSIALYRSEWNRVSPQSTGPGITPTPNFSSSFTQADYERLRGIMEDSISIWNSKGYNVVTFENLNSGQNIPGAYGETGYYGAPGYTIDDLDQMCGGMMHPNFEGNFKFLSCAVYRDEYIENRTPTLIQSTWAQNNGYNSAFPFYNGTQQRCLAGCSAVAVGQIMRNFRHPSTFDWDNMPLNTPTPTTSDFLYQIATDLESEYLNPMYTVSSIDKIERELGKYFYFYSSRTNQYNPPVGTEMIPIFLLCAEWEFSETVGNMTDIYRVGHAWLSSGTRTSYERISNDIYTFIDTDELSPCGNMEVRTETTPDTYNYMIWGYGGRYDGYYINTYDGLPGLPNSAKRIWKESLNGFAIRQ